MPDLSPELLDVVAELRARAKRWRGLAKSYRDGNYSAESIVAVEVRGSVLEEAAHAIEQSEHTGAHERAQKGEG